MIDELPVNHTCQACGGKVDLNNGVCIFFKDFTKLYAWSCRAEDCYLEVFRMIQDMRVKKKTKLDRNVEQIFKNKLGEK